MTTKVAGPVELAGPAQAARAVARAEPGERLAVLVVRRVAPAEQPVVLVERLERAEQPEAVAPLARVEVVRGRRSSTATAPRSQPPSILRDSHSTRLRPR